MRDVVTQAASIPNCIIAGRVREREKRGGCLAPPPPSLRPPDRDSGKRLRSYRRSYLTQIKRGRGRSVPFEPEHETSGKPTLSPVSPASFRRQKLAIFPRGRRGFRSRIDHTLPVFRYRRRCK